MKKILAALFVTLFLCTSAQAYTLGFDPTGSGNETVILNAYEMIDGMQLLGYAEAADGSAVSPLQDIWTFQGPTGDFVEDFTLRVAYGEHADNTDTDFYSNIFLDVSLTGNYNIITGLTTFSVGSAIMYLDADGDRDYTGADNDIASLTLTNSLATTVGGSLLESTLSLDMDLQFVFDSIDLNFWEDALQAKVDNGWLLALAAGRIIQTDGLNINDNGTPGDPTDDYVDQVTWTTNGIEATFDVVPEPATMLLFGLGLIGLAGASRRKLS